MLIRILKQNGKLKYIHQRISPTKKGQGVGVKFYY